MDNIFFFYELFFFCVQHSYRTITFPRKDKVHGSAEFILTRQITQHDLIKAVELSDLSRNKCVRVRKEVGLG